MGILLAMPSAPRLAAAGTTRIYVANTGGDTIDIIDPETNKVVDKMTGFDGPEAVRFSPDASRVYITNHADMALFVYDRKTKKLIKKIPLEGHTGYVDDMAVTKDGKWALVCIHSKPGALDIVDTTTLQRVKSVAIEFAQHDIVLTGDDKYAISAAQEGSLTIIDIRSGEIAWDWKSPHGPVGVAGDPEWQKSLQFTGIRVIAVENNPDGSGRRILATLGGLDGFVAVDFATHKEVARIKIPGDHIGFGGPGGAGPSHGIAITPDGKNVWVNDRPSNAVYVYSLPDFKPMGTVPMPQHALPGKDPIGAFPFWITFTPDSKTAYVTNSWLRQVTAIDTKTMKVVANIPVGERPVRISTMVAP